mgnify:CR=1 FL=1
MNMIVMLRMWLAILCTNSHVCCNSDMYVLLVCSLPKNPMDCQDTFSYILTVIDIKSLELTMFSSVIEIDFGISRRIAFQQHLPVILPAFIFFVFLYFDVRLCIFHWLWDIKITFLEEISVIYFFVSMRLYF